MNILEIMVALLKGNLTLFIGTGFSRYLTNGRAPDWLALMVHLAEVVDHRGRLKNKLFNLDPSSRNVISCKFELSICAQILQLTYEREKKDIRQEVANFLKSETDKDKIDSKKVHRVKTFFADYPSLNIVTTNYDTLLTDYIFTDYRVVLEGVPVFSKFGSKGNVFHIHGSIIEPKSIVLTIADYFNFQDKDTYLSRKFYTLLQETSLVIIGYSLNDFNLNSILNEAQTARAVSLTKGDIYLVTRDDVDNIFKEYYAYTYGVRVIDDTDIDSFLKELNRKREEAKDILNEAKHLLDVLGGKEEYTDDFLKMRDSLFQILLFAELNRINLYKSKAFIRLLVNLLERKKKFCGARSAWEQYDHLAEWLVEVGTRIEITDPTLKTSFESLCQYSFETMSKSRVWGRSWDAYFTWINGFRKLHRSNQKLLEGIIKKEFTILDDAYDLIT